MHSLPHFNPTQKLRKIPCLSVCLGYLLFIGPYCQDSNANPYKLLPGSDLIGQTVTIRTRFEDTFVGIARDYGMGLDELVSANPDVDPWIPGDGTRITIPSQYILPNVKHEGIIINLAELRLYYFPSNPSKVVHTYPVGIGVDTAPTPIAYTKVVSKTKDPYWHVPVSIQNEHKEKGIYIPKVVKPGPQNPLGAYAVYLQLPSYLIHGTNQPAGVGQRVSHGCIRMYPEDIAELFKMVKPGIRVQIIHQPFKIGGDQHHTYLEVHPSLREYRMSHTEQLSRVRKMVVSTPIRNVSHQNISAPLLKETTRSQTGMPVRINLRTLNY